MITEQAAVHTEVFLVLVNNRPIRVHGPEATGAQIKRAADVPENFMLYDVRGEQVADDQRVRVHERERFTAISGQDVS